MKKIVVALLLLVLLVSSLATLASVKQASAQSSDVFPSLAMPVELVNYTITNVNGSLWATVDGDYPIYVINQSAAFNGEIPMVYPMPPGTTNIHVYLGDEELSWSNFTQIYPDQVHHTAIGDWWMISSVIGPVSNFFELKIHYQHPLQTANGSYLFLYDLNISPYLSPQNNNSTCYYTIRMDANFTNLHAYTTQTDSIWNPINFTTKQQGGSQVVFVEEHSEYSKPLLGDFVTEFSNRGEIAEFPVWAVPAVLAALSVAALIYFKKLHHVSKSTEYTP